MVRGPDGSASESGPKETKDSDQRPESEADAGPEIAQAAEQQEAASIVESVPRDVQALSTERASASGSGADVQVKGPYGSASESDAKDSDQRPEGEADPGPEIAQAAEQQEAASIVESVPRDALSTEPASASGSGADVQVRGPDGSASESGFCTSLLFSLESASEEQQEAESIVESVPRNVQALSTEPASASGSGADVQALDKEETAKGSNLKTLQQIAAEPKPAALNVLHHFEPVQQDEEEEEQEGVMEVWEESEGGHESFDGSDAGWRKVKKCHRKG
eukprot:s1650_g8.t5